MELTLIRHGESEANVSGRWQGQGDSPLSDRGQRQARALAMRLMRHEFDRIISSDLARARHTAEALDRPLTTHESWREINVGAWEGLTRSEVAERFPEEIMRLKDGATDVPVGGGESWDDLRARVHTAFDGLREAHDGERVLLVSHGGLISTLLSGLLGVSTKPPRPLGRVANTGISTLDLEEGNPRLARFNDVGHESPCSEWARERRDAGHGVLTFVSVAPVPHPRDGSGRARGNAKLVSMERLADAYGGFDHVTWIGGGEAQGCATVLAERAAVPLASSLRPSWNDLSTVAGALVGKRVAVVIPTTSVGELAAEVLGIAAGSLRPPPHGAVSHVVFEGDVKVLADYAVTAHLSHERSALDEQPARHV